MSGEVEIMPPGQAVQQCRAVTEHIPGYWVTRWEWRCRRGFFSDTWYRVPVDYWVPDRTITHWVPIPIEEQQRAYVAQEIRKLQLQEQLRAAQHAFELNELRRQRELLDAQALVCIAEARANKVRLINHSGLPALPAPRQLSEREGALLALNR